ncbi:hypothetical protein ACHAWF_012577, partial [Thalassiosira exigua]
RALRYPAGTGSQAGDPNLSTYPNPPPPSRGDRKAHPRGRARRAAVIVRFIGAGLRASDMTPRPNPVGVLSRLCRACERRKLGEDWRAQFLAIYVAASLTYSYGSVGARANLQVAVMTVITLFGASPLATTQLIPASIGAFVGGQRILGSAGFSLEEPLDVSPSHYLWLFFLSVTTEIVWHFVVNAPRRKLLDGCAGRLGTTTFLGMNLAMIAFVPAGVVDVNRYYYGLARVVHAGEEDSSLSLASAWDFTEEAEAAAAYVLAVLWLAVVSGGTRVVHEDYIERCKEDDDEGEQPPKPLNNVLVPVLWALVSMLMINATGYKHAPALYNGFAVGAYVGMASLRKIPSVSRFASVSLFAAGWGLMLTPLFVGFAGKSGFTAMLGHVSLDVTLLALEKLNNRFGTTRTMPQEEIRLQPGMPEVPSNFQTSPAAMDGDEEEPSSPHRHHKPKKDTFYTKQQRRQQQRLWHLQEEADPPNEDGPVRSPPELHHRAWSALPTEGEAGWHHSLE